MDDSKETSLTNSEHDESLELQEGSNMKSDIEKCESPTQKSGIEHSKPRRRGRRGKKRKQRKGSIGVCENEAHEEEAGESNGWKSDDDVDSKIGDYTDTVMVRPINVPKAPENYNTFIMDEHDECHLYMSFETPNPYMLNPEELRDQNCAVIEPFEDAAYIDIDYEYESPQDFDNVAYYDKEFEESYKNNRFDELVRLSREELVAGIQELERRLQGLSEDLVRVNPSPVLEKLQAELLELQEKHSELKECNTRLTALMMDSEAGSAPGESPANSQTLTDGFSPQSGFVSPNYMIETKGELVLSELSPQKGWSPYSPVDDRRSQGETPDVLRKGWSPYSPVDDPRSLGEMSERSPYSPVDDRKSQGEMPDMEEDSVSFSKTSDLLKLDSPVVNTNIQLAVTVTGAECSPSQTSNVKLENFVNSSTEDGESRILSEHSEYMSEVDQTTLKNDLVHNSRFSSKKVPHSMVTLEELNLDV